MRKWELQLKRHDALLKELSEEQEKGEGRLRFKRPFVLVSDIAQQYFCEKKVEMQYLHGEVETERKMTGTEAHEKLLEGSIKAKREDVWKNIHGSAPIFAMEMLLLSKHKDVILAGRPDSVLFQKGLPQLVFEYKFSRSSVAYRTYHVQARTYGIQLREMGFDTTQLFYAIVVVSPEARNDKKLRRRVVEAIMKKGLIESELQTENAIIYLCKFDEETAEEDLEWALEYWQNARKAQRTGNVNKCRNCEYQVECQKSTHKSLTAF